MIYIHNSIFLRIRVDQTGLKKTFESYDPDQYQLLEGEERRYMDPESQKVNYNSFLAASDN